MFSTSLLFITIISQYHEKKKKLLVNDKNQGYLLFNRDFFPFFLLFKFGNHCTYIKVFTTLPNCVHTANIFSTPHWSGSEVSTFGKHTSSDLSHLKIYYIWEHYQAKLKSYIGKLFFYRNLLFFDRFV